MTEYIAVLIRKLKRNRVRLRNTFFGLVLLTLIVLLFIFIGFYISAFSDDLLPKDRVQLGQLGDYFGGLLNPIFGLASFLALLATIIYQSKELKLSRKELELTRSELANSAIALSAQNKAIELQSFEQTFFSWIKNYRELLEAVEGEVVIRSVGDYTSKKMSRKGIEFLHDVWQWSLSISAMRGVFTRPKPATRQGGVTVATDELVYTENVPEKIKQAVIPNHFNASMLIEEFPELLIATLDKAWQQVYMLNEYKLDALLRTAYKIIVWIDNQPYSRLTFETKFFYVSIFRSQLSRAELTFLLFNGLSEAGAKFKPLIEKYALFDNLNIEKDDCMKLLATKYKDSAFNSDLARCSLHDPTAPVPLFQ